MLIAVSNVTDIDSTGTGNVVLMMTIQTASQKHLLRLLDLYSVLSASALRPSADTNHCRCKSSNVQFACIPLDQAHYSVQVHSVEISVKMITENEPTKTVIFLPTWSLRTLLLPNNAYDIIKLRLPFQKAWEV